MPDKHALERWPCDRLAEWLTATTGDECEFLRSADAPDVVYRFRGRELGMEVTTAFADDQAHAKFLFKDEPEWLGVEPDQQLAQDVLDRIREKSLKRYGKNVLLVIRIPPGVTTVEALRNLLATVARPSPTPFIGIYAVGNFPITSTSAGGVQVLPLLPMLGTSPH